MMGAHGNHFRKAANTLYRDGGGATGRDPTAVSMALSISAGSLSQALPAEPIEEPLHRRDTVKADRASLSLTAVKTRSAAHR